MRDGKQILIAAAICAGIVSMFAADGLQASWNAKDIELKVEDLTGGGNHAGAKLVHLKSVDGERFGKWARDGFSDVTVTDVYGCKRMWSFLFAAFPPFDGKFIRNCVKRPPA